MNGLELAKKVVAEWRKNRGNQSTYYKCQHFDGWYMQWGLEGFTAAAEKSIAIYPTAQAAANASPMEAGITSVNDKRIQPGWRLYFRYGTPGHIVTAIGWDGNRLLVTNTSNGGDKVIDLGNNVKVAHADSLGLPFIGVSRQNGRNKAVGGITPYQHGAAPAPAGNARQRTVRGSVKELLRRPEPGTHKAAYGKSLRGGVVGNFDGWTRGQTVTVQGVTSNVWFHGGINGGWFAAAGFTSQSTSGLPEMRVAAQPTPKALKFRTPAKGQYYYLTRAKAQAGTGYIRTALPGNTVYNVVQAPAGGSVLIDVPRIGQVWVGTRRNPAATYMG